MTPKQDKFFREWIIDFNGKQAAIRAGYSKKTAENQASRLLSNAKFSDHISKLIKKSHEKSGLTLQMVLDELQRIAFLDLRKLYNKDGTLKDITDLDDDTARALAGVEVVVSRKYGVDYVKKYKSIDKKGALELLGKHFGAFIEVKHTGDLNVTFTDDV